MPLFESQDITEFLETPDMMDPTEANEAIDPSEAKDPIDPTDSADPMDPIDSTDPVHPMDSTDPLELIDRIDRGELPVRVDASASAEVIAPIVHRSLHLRRGADSYSGDIPGCQSFPIVLKKSLLGYEAACATAASTSAVGG